MRPLPKEEGEASGAVKIGAHPETVSHQQLLREKERKLRGVALGGEAVDQKFTQGRLELPSAAKELETCSCGSKWQEGKESRAALWGGRKGRAVT